MQLVAHLTEEPEVPGLMPGLAHTLVEIDQEIFSTPLNRCCGTALLRQF